MPPLVPELYVTDLTRSLDFYRGVLGFEVVYARDEDHFAYLAREGAELVLEQPVEGGSVFAGAPLDTARGVGVSLQIACGDAETLHRRCVSCGAQVPLALEMRWYRRAEDAVGVRQFVVEDPDRYVLRFAERIGVRRRPCRAPGKASTSPSG